jgi:hypothetical protein
VNINDVRRECIEVRIAKHTIFPVAAIFGVPKDRVKAALQKQHFEEQRNLLRSGPAKNGDSHASFQRRTPQMTNKFARITS